MLLPGVVLAVGVVGQSRVDPALGGHRMGAQGMDLGDDGHLEPGIGGQGGAQTGQTSPHDNDIVADHL